MSPVPKIGVFVLETLTTGMYRNPLDAVRELIQNSTDSLRLAEEQSIVSRGEGKISIKIDKQKKNMVLRDNGIGIGTKDVVQKLINIGMSDKDIEKDAGFRGIGRLAAIAYCQRLVFRTSIKGENIQSVISFDCTELIKSISPNIHKSDELVDVFDRFSSYETENEDPYNHFFEVELEGIHDSLPQFLDSKTLEDYLSQVAPVDMDAHRFIFKPRLDKWLEQHGLSIFTVNLVIDDSGREKQVFKPYKTHYYTQDKKYEFDIGDIIFFPEEISAKPSYWGWYGDTELLGMIEDEKVAGFRIRKNNIAIGGPEQVSELFSHISKSYERFNSWYLGEIHVISHDIIPNSHRDGFEENEAWRKIKDDLNPFFVDRSKDAYSKSQIRNLPIQKVISSCTKLIKEVKEDLNTGLVSQEQQQSILAKMAKEKNKAYQVLESRSKKDPKINEIITPVITELKELENKIENENNYALKKARSDLDKKQRILLKEILKILYDILDNETYRKASKAILEKYGLKE